MANELRAALAKAGLHGKLADAAIEAMQAHLVRTPAEPDNADGYGYNVDQLRANLSGRDAFIVKQGLWNEFVSALTATEPKEVM